MGFLQDFELSLSSLLIFNVLPFLYFAYQSRYRFRPEICARLDIFLCFVAVVLGLIVILNSASPAVQLTRESYQIALLHLAPMVLILFIVTRSRNFSSQSKTPRATENKDVYDYKPVPLNKEIEHVGWDDLIIDPHLKEELFSVINLLRDPVAAKKYGIEVPKGILLYGPPGTGKTTIAKAIATTANLSFFVLKFDEIVSKWVGESEKNLSRLFKAASTHAPAVVFIDEVDSIAKARSGSQQWADNILNHLLQLVDGIVKTEGLYLIAATNRVDLVDSALKRSGRLDKVIEVPLPDFQARAELFRLYLSKLRLEGNVDLGILAQITDGRSGAEIKGICNQAGLNAFKRESVTGKKREYSVTLQDLERALQERLIHSQS